MNSETPQSNDPGRQDKHSSSGLRILTGFLLALTPAAMFLAMVALRPNVAGFLMRAIGEHSAWLIVPGVCAFACCFYGSYLMFALRTVLAIVAGVFFLTLNVLIAFFLGCALTFKM